MAARPASPSRDSFAGVVPVRSAAEEGCIRLVVVAAPGGRIVPRNSRRSQPGSSRTAGRRRHSSLSNHGKQPASGLWTGVAGSLSSSRGVPCRRVGEGESATPVRDRPPVVFHGSTTKRLRRPASRWTGLPWHDGIRPAAVVPARTSFEPWTTSQRMHALRTRFPTEDLTGAERGSRIRVAPSPQSVPPACGFPRCRKCSTSNRN